MKDNIGIDIDSTVFNTEDVMLNYIGLFYNERFPKDRVKKDLSDLKVDEFVIKDAIDLAVSDVNLKIYKDAKKVIQWLSEFFNIWFLTYRDPRFTFETFELLDKLEVPYNTTFFTRNLGKHKFIVKHDIQVMIEDDDETITNISERTNAISLIYDQPWNQNITQDLNKIRVFNWKEIKDYFIIKGI